MNTTDIALPEKSPAADQPMPDLVRRYLAECAYRRIDFSGLSGVAGSVEARTPPQGA